jgi:hypothetical protein
MRKIIAIIIVAFGISSCEESVSSKERLAMSAFKYGWYKGLVTAKTIPADKEKSEFTKDSIWVLSVIRNP